MKNLFKKNSCLVLAILMLCLVVPLSSCSKEDGENEPRTVVDMKGTTVSIPAKVERYIVLWKSYTGVMAMLDGGEGLVGADYQVSSKADGQWLAELCPATSDLTVVTEAITVEEVLELNVDVVFWQSSACNDLAADLINVGIAAVNVDFTDYESMKKSVSLAADILGTDSAKQKANAYNTYLDGVIARVSAKTNTLTDDQKVTVLNLRNLESLRADGKDTVADTWINLCGGINIVSANNLSGNQYLNQEQVFEWNPDFIVSSNEGDDTAMMSSDVYASLTAVQNSHVYTNPQGVFWWNRYSVETPLQILWAANTLHPDLFGDVDIISEAKAFYSEFFGYEINDAGVQQMLVAGAPVK